MGPAHRLLESLQPDVGRRLWVHGGTPASASLGGLSEQGQLPGRSLAVSGEGWKAHPSARGHPGGSGLEALWFSPLQEALGIWRLHGPRG